MTSTLTMSVILSLALITFVNPSGCPCSTTTSSEDVINNHILKGHVISRLIVIDVGQCFHSCVYDNHRCRSFNTGKKQKMLVCELNASNKNISPLSLQPTRGWSYHDVNKRLPSEVSYFKDCGCSHYNEQSCECMDGYVGSLCSIKTRSCQDYLRFKKTYQSGIYSVFDGNDSLFPVFCDMDQATLSAWTAVLSYALKYNRYFKKKPFYMDNPINESSPNWEIYRLSLERMKTIRASSRYWMASCSYSTYGVDGRDYAVARWKDIDLLTLSGKGCDTFSYINVRGSNCTECTTWVHQGLPHLSGGVPMFLVAVPYGELQGCFLKAPHNSKLFDESFGHYNKINSYFRCTENSESTTQFWFGGAV